MRRRAAVLCLALLIDAGPGEPPAPAHPVVWMGGTLRLALGGPPAAFPLLRGLVGLAGAAALWGLSAAWLGVRLRRLPAWAGLPLEAALLKTLFSLRQLGLRALETASLLRAGRLERARRHVGRHLVSRPTAGLSPPLVAAAAIESVAENLTDSVVAPLVFYAAGGLPAAAVYRLVNTADSMVGYRTPGLERLGRAAARADDLLSLVPARLAYLLLALVAAAEAGRGRAALAWGRLGGARTASPNAGWTMGAMAGALGRRLEKPGQYRLGEGFPQPGPEDIERAVGLMRRAGWLAAALLGGGLAGRAGRRGAAGGSPGPARAVRAGW